MTPEQLRHLTAELPKGAEEHLSHKGGLSYLSTPYVINRLNQIFGFGMWRHVVTNHSTRKEGNGLLSTCDVELQIWLGSGAPDQSNAPNIVIKDVGVCDAEHGSYATQLDMAHKGAISDGIKRCARYLGSQFQPPDEKPASRAQKAQPAFWCGKAREAVSAREAEHQQRKAPHKVASPLSSEVKTIEKERKRKAVAPPKAEAGYVKLPGPSLEAMRGDQRTVEEKRTARSRALHAKLGDVAKWHSLPREVFIQRIHKIGYAWSGFKDGSQPHGATWSQVHMGALKKLLGLLEEIRACSNRMEAISRLEAAERENGIKWQRQEVAA